MNNKIMPLQGSNDRSFSHWHDHRYINMQLLDLQKGTTTGPLDTDQTLQSLLLDVQNVGHNQQVIAGQVRAVV